MRALLIGCLLGGIAAAQPAPADLERAKELYTSGEAAMRTQDFATAARDYGAAYALTRDPVLFFKIGQANERAGTCDVALVYYRRYLDEATPNEAHQALTQERITACSVVAEPAPAPPPDRGVPTASPTVPTPVTAPVPAPSPGRTALPGRNQAAWLLVGGGVALLTVGAVLAYSADSAEKDIADLYVGFGGVPPTFSDKTKQTYEDLIDEGKRYERLSWISFGLAGACGIAAGVLFYRARNSDEHVLVTPMASPSSAGVSARLRF